MCVGVLLGWGQPAFLVVAVAALEESLLVNARLEWRNSAVLLYLCCGMLPCQDQTNVVEWTSRGMETTLLSRRGFCIVSVTPTEVVSLLGMKAVHPAVCWCLFVSGEVSSCRAFRAVARSRAGQATTHVFCNAPALIGDGDAWYGARSPRECVPADK